MPRLRQNSHSPRSVVQKEVRRQRTSIIERTPAVRASRQRRYARVIFLALAVIIAGLAVCIFLFSESFRIHRMIVVGNDSVADERVEELINTQTGGRIWGLIPRDNILLFNTEEAEAVLTEEIVQLRQVTIKRQLPDILKIYVEEREPALIWQAGERRYYLDVEGTISKEIHGEPEFLLPTLVDESTRDVAPKEKLVSKDYVDFVVSLADSFQKETGLEYAALTTTAPVAREVDVKTVGGWVIYFTSERTLESQYQKLLLILNKELKPGQREKLEYVDLRIKDKIFYK